MVYKNAREFWVWQMLSHLGGSYLAAGWVGADDEAALDEGCIYSDDAVDPSTWVPKEVVGADAICGHAERYAGFGEASW